MYLQRLEWHHVKADISVCYAGLGKPKVPVRMRDGRTKVYARLYRCSFVCIELWLHEPDLNNAVTQAVILLKLNRVLRSKWNMIRKYLKEE